jgi:hypothetical protein
LTTVKRVLLVVLADLGDVSADGTVLLLEVDDESLLLLFALVSDDAVPEDEASRDETASPSDSASDTFADEVAPAYSFSDCEPLRECLFQGRLCLRFVGSLSSSLLYD